MKRAKRLVVLAATIAALTATALVTSGTASAETCGWLGSETYRHCDPTTRVMIDARNIWGTTYRDICVGYGDHNLGYLSYWRITYAWYNGKLC
jgi:hypothetical protein